MINILRETFEQTSIMAHVHTGKFQDMKTSTYHISEALYEKLVNTFASTSDALTLEMIELLHVARIIQHDEFKASIDALKESKRKAKEAKKSPPASPASPTEAAAAAPVAPVAGICEGIKKDGTKCTKKAKPGMRFCGIHAPKA